MFEIIAIYFSVTLLLDGLKMYLVDSIQYI